MAKRSILGQIETLGNPNTPMGMAFKRVTNDIGWGMRLNKELMGYLSLKNWALSAPLIGGFLIWPAFSDEFKEETFGIGAGGPDKSVQEAVATYKYEKEEVGAMPALSEAPEGRSTFVAGQVSAYKYEKSEVGAIPTLSEAPGM
jgi:hypothetical protein